MRTPKKAGLTPEAWQDLLDFLGPTPARAGARYEEIRRRLIRIFECRGSAVPEELADDTIDRVAKKCGQLADSYVGDPALYFCGVARRVFLEAVRKHSAPPPMPDPDPWEEKEVMHQCLDQCMARLTSKRRQLILDYYQGEKGGKIARRRELAERLGKTTNALRIEAHRIRASLQKCVFRCLEHNGME